MILKSQTKTPIFWLVCDGKSVLQWLCTTHITDPTKAHADLLSATRYLMTHSGVLVNLHHVKGHQDSNCAGPFTREATLNIKADQLTRTKLETYQSGPAIFHIPWSQGACYLSMQRVKKSFANEIWDYINGQRTTEYWRKRRALTQGIWNTIDWESVRRAMQEIPVNKHRWVAKYVSGHFATGKNMCRWKFRMSMKCPWCDVPKEDKQHILTCPDPEARNLWEKLMKDLYLWLRDEGTDTYLREHLMNYLRSWPLPPSTSNPIPTFVADQEAIGHQYVWDGWLCHEWRAHQERLWKQTRSRKSSQRWTSKIIKKMWNVAWDMWEQWNEALHNSDINCKLILEKDVNDQIRQIYQVSPGQLARVDLGLMQHPVDHQIQLPLHTKQQWLESIAAALHRKQLHEHGAMVDEQRIMETWVVWNPVRRAPVPVNQQCTITRQPRPPSDTR